ncbi:MAG: methyl-accepting chemotaxis protein [Planctomycetes bacterium]|nr:methyl-accepting chemotaxis protein [Planctomycetota bacterium]
MRDNGPVTGRETPFPDGQVLVSRTDARGVITFANEAFVQISGFTLDELMGKSHNLVRHPEMPAGAFADLWTTIQAGHAWVGLVKNRSKNGDHYWVRANVTPIVENGQVTGYISIRVKPTREEVAFAEQVYADLRSGRGGWSVTRGRIRRTGALPALQRALAPLSRRIALVMLAVLALMIAGLGVGMVGFQQSNQAIDDLSHDEMGAIALTARIAQEAQGAVNQLHLATRANADTGTLAAAAEAAKGRLDTMLSELTATEMDPAETEANRKLAADCKALGDEVVRKGCELARAGKRAELAELVNGPGFDRLQPILRAASDTVIIQQKQVRDLLAARHADFAVKFGLALGLVGLATALGLLAAWRVPRSLRRNLDTVTDHLDQLARDEINTKVETGRADEFGAVNLALSALQTRMTYVRLSEKETRNRTLRDFDRTIGSVLSHVAEAVSELKGTAERQTTVASAVAGSAQSVSAAATEMSASIKEISGQTAQVSDLARSAAESAKQSHEVMAKLAAAASEITDVARLIGRIADQTNLLSLNASIEAASAGEAGRGFAVVANEVKGLSARTREATGSIGAKISTIQTDTQAAVQALEALAAQIARLSENAQAIAAAVEEQTSVTGEIAQNADRTNSAAGETGQAASQVGEASTALAQITTSLEEAVRKFKAGV